jgi:hypothetical protein
VWDDIVAMRFNRLTGELVKWRNPPAEEMELAMEMSPTSGTCGFGLAKTTTTR